jgi:hypothetical protein
MQLNDEYGPRVLGGPRATLLIDIEERARARRGVGGAGGSAAPDQDDDDDERERKCATEAGGKRHGQLCVTYEARRDREPNAQGQSATVSNDDDSRFIERRLILRTGWVGLSQHVRLFAARVSACVRANVADTLELSTRRRTADSDSHLHPFPLGPIPSYTSTLLAAARAGFSCFERCLPHWEHSSERPAPVGVHSAESAAGSTRCESTIGGTLVHSNGTQAHSRALNDARTRRRNGRHGGGRRECFVHGRRRRRQQRRRRGSRR